MQPTCPRAISAFAFLFLAVAAPRAARAEPDIIFSGDFRSGSALQWVRRNPHAGGATIGVPAALVTAVKVSGAPPNENMTLNLQLPPALNNESTYPRFSALKSFGPATASAPAVGDCVAVEGAIGAFHSSTQLSPASVTPLDPAACGAEAITPFTVTVAEIATDTDAVTPDNQGGMLTEALESVLVRVDAATTQTTNGGSGAFVVGDTASGVPVIRVGNFLYQYSSTLGQKLQLTGVVDQFDSFQLLPRSAADIVVLP
jgi:hypothetical protein